MGKSIRIQWLTHAGLASILILQRPTSASDLSLHCLLTDCFLKNLTKIPPKTLKLIMDSLRKPIDHKCMGQLVIVAMAWCL